MSHGTTLGNETKPRRRRAWAWPGSLIRTAAPKGCCNLAKDQGSCPAGHGPPGLGLSSVISLAVSCPFSIYSYCCRPV